MDNSIHAALIGCAGRIGSAIISLFSKDKPQKSGNYINNDQIVFGKGKISANIERTSSTCNVNNKQVVLGSGESEFNSK